MDTSSAEQIHEASLALLASPGVRVEHDAIGDMADMARLLDRLPQVDGVFGMAMHDVPPGAGDVVGLRIMAENTSKHKGVGQLESELTIFPAQAVIDNEIIAYARRLLRGVELTPEALAVEVTREVGISGDFLSREHTLKHFRSELFEPSLLFREKHAAWEAQGSRPLSQKAAALAEDVMGEPRSGILPDEQSTELRAIEKADLGRMRSQ